MAHDRRFDAVFVYAVRSTGIYCRPSCPSRRPSRAQVSFFPGPGPAKRKNLESADPGQPSLDPKATWAAASRATGTR
ncbi:MAG: Ada metal-binding domain-containing protein [Dehalococcoidia bacterium]